MPLSLNLGDLLLFHVFSFFFVFAFSFSTCLLGDDLCPCESAIKMGRDVGLVSVEVNMLVMLRLPHVHSDFWSMKI